MRWLITGGCGFLGTCLIDRVLRDNSAARVRIIDNLAVGQRDDLAAVCDFAERLPETVGDDGADERVVLIVGDVRDPTLAERACQDVDILVHLAANTGVIPSIEDPLTDFEANVVGTFNYLEAARRNRVARFVFASSGAPIGECVPPIHEGLVARPISPYGASKLAGEGYCSAYHGSFGLNTVALRFGNVYGPRSTHKGSVVAKFIRQALDGETLVVYGDGNQTRDFIYIDDLVDALVAASNAEVGGEVFQIASQSETAINELVALLCEALREVAGVEASVRHAGARAGEVRRNYSDISKARRLLGWQPRWTLAEGLAATVRWFAETRRPQVAVPD